MCQAGKGMGLQSIELLTVDDFPTLKKYDLRCAMVSGVPGGITSGLNRLENHDKIVEFFEQSIPKVAEAGYPNIICFSGNRKGLNDEKGHRELRHRFETDRRPRRETQGDRLHGAS